MSKTLAVLAIIGAVVLAQIEVEEFAEEDAADNGSPRQIQYKPGGGRHHGHGPSYLRNVTREARMEYYSILRNSALTIAQQKMEIVAWAERHGVEGQLAEFNVNQTLIKEETRQNITLLLSVLPYAVQRMHEIIDNEDQTFAQQHQALRNLTMENPTLFHAARFINDLFSRRCCGGRGGPGPRGGPRGPGREMDSSFAVSEADMEEE
ncbi:unnamed protein product [Cylicocyclus nassatus]|uniref:SXP/RAL-2 family protein Ani s 5-like cation-binding domain-containing protein n=1 Tax=Cylicocyclus nassatus TaxID=53992 RepID=A0AA36H0Q2_CYLNA|nr:unnamed protein product [Cylicocyclus nassatus]